MFNLLFGVLLLLRFLRLDLKPVHHDESINGWFVEQLWKTGNFHYDPTNYHGPLLFYMFQAAEALGGWGIASFRFVTVLFSALTVLWLFVWTKKRFDLSQWWLLGLLFSPGYLFFSRSAIHESVLVFFLVVAACAWVDVFALRRPKSWPLILYGITGMALLKETFIIALGLALVCTLPFIRSRRAVFVGQAKSLLFHGLICLLIWAAFYSSFGGNPHGLLDFFYAFLPWTQTGTQGHGHEKEFAYFIKLIWNYEPATMLALIVTALGLLRSGWVRVVCVWALVTLLAYSWIPYKTPWCLVSIQIPIWFAAGVVLAKTNFVMGWVGQVGLAALGVASVSAWGALNFHRLPDHHPYVYVQSTETAKVFADSLLRQAEEKPERRQARLLFATAEPWPFPWWLAKYPHQSSQYLRAGSDIAGDLILIDDSDVAIAEPLIHGEFWKAHFSVRDSRIPAVAYLRKSIFDCPFDRCEEEVRP